MSDDYTINPQKCTECNQEIVWTDKGYASEPGQVYSDYGSNEVGNRGMCEWCFDKMEDE